MDPTLKLCLIQDSFDPDVKVNDEPPYMYVVSSDELKTLVDLKFTLDHTTRNKTPNMPPVYIDTKLYSQLNQQKDKFKGINEAKFTKARDKANPFEKLGKGIFNNRAGLKIANIDAVFSLTGLYNLTSYQNKSPKLFTFADFAGAPGAFDVYIQFRRPISRGYGISLKTGTGLQWDVKSIDMKRFDILDGSDATGNLYTNWDWMIKYIKLREGNGVDFVMGDGGFESKGDESRQEYLMTRLFITEAYTQIMCLQTGGNFLLKAYDTVTEVMGQVLFLIACCFNDGICRFKPVTSRPANSECYIVAKNRRDSKDIAQVIKGLTEIIMKYNHPKLLEASFEFKKLFEFKGNTYDRFTKWLVSTNNEAIQNQLTTVNNILDLLDGKEIDLPEYDISKCMTLWKLPGSYNFPKWISVNPIETSETKTGNYAYITLVMNGDRYVPGAAVLARGLKRFNGPNGTNSHPIYCMVTNDVSARAQEFLGRVFDRVLVVPKIEYKTTQMISNRQIQLYQSWISASFTKWAFLNPDIFVDLKVPDKVVFLDSDLLPRRNLDRLFTLSAPAIVVSTWRSEVYQKGGIPEIYGDHIRGDLHFGEPIPRNKIAYCVNIKNEKRDKKDYTACTSGVTAMLTPDKKVYNRMIQILEHYKSKSIPYGHPGVVNGHDEQMLAELMISPEFKRDPVCITAGYAWDAGATQWVPEYNRAVIHYYGDQKPWFIPRNNKWGDTNEWWSVADLIIQELPEYANFFQMK